MGLLDFGENGISFGSWSGQDIWNGISDVFKGLFTGDGSIGESITNPSGWWDRFKNGETNNTNKEIADENLEYQKERNSIEDARYEDETAYNRSFSEDERAYQRTFAEDERAYQRAFAEDERAYNRALQQTIFDREDTALERQAQSLSSMGINPLSQQLNGLGAGQAVSASVPGSSVPGSSSLPGMSSRGGSALHNDFQMQDKGLFQALSPLLSLADTLNGVETSQYQRDALALQNDAQFLQNMSQANKLGIIYKGYIPYHTGGKGYRQNIYNFNDIKTGQPLEDTIQYKRSLYSGWKQNVFSSMPDWEYTLDSLGYNDVYKSAARALTKVSDLYNKGINNLFDRDNEAIKKLGKSANGNFNPFQFLLNMFGF